nr:PAS domain S-box protein [Gemmatimonadales bacterium]
GSDGTPVVLRSRTGTELLEVSRRIEGTAWRLVAMVPNAEVQRPVDDQSTPLELVIVGLVLALTGLGFGLWRWRRSDAIATRAAEHREALGRLRRVFDAQGAVAIGIRPGGVIFEWNRSAEQYFGCTRLEVLGRHMDPDQPPAPHAARAWRTVAELAATTGRESVEAQIELPGGEDRILGWSTTTFAPHEGDPGGTILVGVDVTAARRAEDDLRRSEERYRLLFDANPEPMWVYDTDTLRFLAVNDAAVRTYGFSRADFLAMTIEDIRPADDRPALGRALTRPEGATPAGGVWCHRRRNGDLVQVEVAAHDIRFAGRPARLVLATDVTERVRREADLARLNAAVTQSAEAVIITDMEPRIVYVNPAFEQITGYSRAEVLGRNPNILKSGEQGAGFYADLWGRLRAGQPWKGPLRNRRKDGGVYLADAVISPIRDAAGRVVNYVGLQRDITNEHRLAEQLRQAQKMEAVGQLTGGIAHDFNNLLGVILANSELLRTELAPGGAPVGYLEEIATAGTRGAELVHKLLAFSRQELIELRPVDLGRILPELLATLRRLLPESIDVRMEVPQRLPPVLGDRGAIEQMLLNLATNARDAMPAGGSLVFTARRGSTASADPRPCRRWDAAPTGQTVQIVVSDSGQGMDRHTLDRIFEPFYTTKGPGRGTGLGMAMVYGLMKQHGGFVDIFSAPGEGSTVCLHFPIAAVSEEAAAAPVPPLPGLATGHETILLVEDEPPLRRAATRLLERMGYQVLAAANGIEALEVYDLHRDQVALVVSDMIMPRLGGAGLLRELRQRQCPSPFLLASGYSASTVAHEVLTDPLVSFLEKPWTAAELGRRVRECLDAHPAPAAEAVR